MNAQRIDPRDISLRIALGAVDLAELRLDDCVHRCTEALKIAPNDPCLLHLRGHARWQQGDILAALADFSECIAADRTRPIGYRSRAAIYKWFGKFKPALKDLNEAIRTAPAIAGQYAERAAVRQALGDAQGAAADYQIAVTLNPRDVASAQALRHLEVPTVSLNVDQIGSGARLPR